MCPTLFYLNFFEIRLNRGDVWAKTEVLVIGAFLCCILGSYLMPVLVLFIHVIFRPVLNAQSLEKQRSLESQDSANSEFWELFSEVN